jgi:hypothetical protein
MPFFSSADYLSTPVRFWIWIAFTVPSTTVAFIVYQKVMKRSRAKLQDEEARGQGTSSELLAEGKPSIEGGNKGNS